MSALPDVSGDDRPQQTHKGGPALDANPQERTMELKPEAFRLMRDSDHCPEARAGITVYSCILGTYGLAAQDTRMTGRRHRCVTLDPEGGYPFFTAPEADLVPLGCDHER